MSNSSPEPQLAGFIGKYSPEIAAQLRAARAKLRALFPRGCEMVYDNYNALVFGFGPTPRVSDAILSLVAYPRWITLFFLKGTSLADPHKHLKGSGSRVRSVVLASPADLDTPLVRDFIAQAVKPVQAEFADAPPLTTVIKSVSAKQRPRRPSVPGTRTKGANRQ